MTSHSKNITLYWSISNIITSNDKQQCIKWMDMNLNWVKWIYKTPFGDHVNDANWCPIWISSWIEEKVDDLSKLLNRIFLLMLATNFSMHGSPRYTNTLITEHHYVIIQVNILLYSCHLLEYTQSVLYIPRHDSSPSFWGISVTGEIAISYTISKRYACYQGIPPSGFHCTDFLLLKCLEWKKSHFDILTCYCFFLFFIINTIYYNGKKLDKVVKEATSPSTIWIGVILCWLAKIETGRCILNWRLYQVLLMPNKERSPSHFPTTNPNAIICNRINLSPLFLCLPLIICLDKTLTLLHNCFACLRKKQVIFNMIHQQHINCHVCHILSCPLKVPVLPFFFFRQFFGEYDKQDERGGSSVSSLLLFSCHHWFLAFYVSATTDQIPTILSLLKLCSLIT